MAGQAPNSQNIERVGAGVADSASLVVHPEYMYWRWEWRKVRDVLSGQREIKRQGQLYLKPLSKKQDEDDYLLYLENATFYNMTRQTLNGMIGEVFSRDPVVLGIPKKYKDAIRLRFGKDGSGHVLFSKGVITEQLAMGRYGVLVDAPGFATTEPTSYGVGYAAENILDWDVEEVNGEYVPTRVLLREFKRENTYGSSQQNPWITGAPPNSIPANSSSSGFINKGPKLSSNAQDRSMQSLVRPSAAFLQSYTYRTVYRELVLEEQEFGPRVYAQRVYNESPQTAPDEVIEPVVRGARIPFIPFKFFGATANSPDVEQSPLLDIADLNLSHYRTYAALEWGRIFTALPVYYAPGRDDESAGEYLIGPSVVWEVPEDSTPGILEYKGDGLKALENALNTKESQIAAIGGRMMPGVTGKGSSSPDEVKRSQKSEQALILHCIQACEAGMTDCIRWYLMWRDVPMEQSTAVQYTMNRLFGESGIDSRGLRVFQQLHDEGKLPIQVIYNAVIQTGYLDPETTEEDFMAMLKDPENFPNNPDLMARQRGYASRQQELDQHTIANEADMQNREIDLQEREVELMENAPPPLPPKPPTASGAAVPPKAAGPRPPKPGRAGQATKAPKPGGSS